MDFLIAIGALVFLMVVAYRGFSVIIFAPIAAMVGVLLTDPAAVPPAFTNIFMEKMVGFVKLYLPVFLLGAIFGKLIEMSGFSKSIVYWVIGQVGRERAILSIVLVCAILTYGGVSLFVVVFAVYPFAAEMFRLSNIPKRLIPGTIALGAFTFTMDALPGTPQIQNIIPTTFFKTNTWAAPWLGVVGGVFILIVGLSYLEWRRYRAQKRGEGYGEFQINEPEPIAKEALPNPLIAFLPLVVVGVMNRLITGWIPQFYPDSYTVDLTHTGHPTAVQVKPLIAIWAVEAALLLGIAVVLLFAFRTVAAKFAEGTKSAVAGALLASMNTASEYGFGAVIASLPGFLVIAEALRSIPNPLVNEAVTVTALAGITGSASGGMSIALATMANDFIKAANEAGIPMEVLHRVASMASGGMDTLPHNGAVITLLAVTGLTHRVSYGDIFAITCIKTLAVFVVIAFFYLTGIY
ncbi:MAG: GntP family permease [Rhodomicrobium sp.]|jgi:H+/gluconate symporter-like permease